MSKTVILVAIGLVLIAGVGSGYFLIKSRVSKTGSFGITSTPSESSKETTGESSYQDSSGFSFKYPKNLTVTDATPDDQTYYSFLKLAKGDKEIDITVKNTQAASIADWIAKDVRGESATLAGAVSLAGLSAKQYKAGSKLITVAIDSGVLYLIEGPADGSFWENGQNTIASSMAFAGSANSSASGDNTVYEQEEVVE